MKLILILLISIILLKTTYEKRINNKKQVNLDASVLSSQPEDEPLMTLNTHYDAQTLAYIEIEMKDSNIQLSSHSVGNSFIAIDEKLMTDEDLKNVDSINAYLHTNENKVEVYKSFANIRQHHQDDGIKNKIKILKGIDNKLTSGTLTDEQKNKFKGINTIKKWLDTVNGDDGDQDKLVGRNELEKFYQISMKIGHEGEIEAMFNGLREAGGDHIKEIRIVYPTVEPLNIKNQFKNKMKVLPKCPEPNQAQSAGSCPHSAEIPNLHYAQDNYFNAATGVDYPGSRGIPGVDGGDVRVCTAGNSYHQGHVDLPTIKRVDENHATLKSIYVTRAGLRWPVSLNHDTAVWTEILAKDTAKGVRGLTRDVDGYQSARFQWDVDAGNQVYNEVTAIQRCTNALRRGDVMLLEIQNNVCQQRRSAPAADGTTRALDKGPSEYSSKAMFEAIKSATNQGITVIEAGGNGDDGNSDVNLDAAACETAWNKGWATNFKKDSGAIIVGAAQATAAHEKMSWSTYGSRVDVSAQGEHIMSGGYDDFFTASRGNDESYHGTFGGTSGASPMVTAVAAAMQGVARSYKVDVFSPLQIREIMRSWNISPYSTRAKKIGGPVNLKKGALEAERQALSCRLCEHVTYLGMHFAASASQDAITNDKLKKFACDHLPDRIKQQCEEITEHEVLANFNILGSLIQSDAHPMHHLPIFFENLSIVGETIASVFGASNEEKLAGAAAFTCAPFFNLCGTIDSTHPFAVAEMEAINQGNHYLKQAHHPFEFARGE